MVTASSHKAAVLMIPFSAYSTMASAQRLPWQRLEVSMATPCSTSTSSFNVMTPYVEAIAKSDAKKLSPAWKNGLQGILDSYLGATPKQFTYEGRTFTPKSFAAYIGLDSAACNNYVSLHVVYPPSILVGFRCRGTRQLAQSAVMECSN